MNAPEFQSINVLTGDTADPPLRILIASALHAVDDVMDELEQLRAERDALRAEVAELRRADMERLAAESNSSEK